MPEVRAVNLPRLNFPAYRFRVKGDTVWDPLRGAWVKLTPEEWVRRHVVEWLIREQGVVAQYIVQEHPVELEGMTQRADIVVFDRQMRPELLVECKAPGVAIDGSVLAQAVRYNSVVGAARLMLTNGLEHYFYDK